MFLILINGPYSPSSYGKLVYKTIVYLYIRHMIQVIVGQYIMFLCNSPWRHSLSIPRGHITIHG